MPTLRGGINTVTDGLVFLVDAKNPTSAYSKDTRSAQFTSSNSETLTSTSSDFKIITTFSYGCWVKFDSIAAFDTISGRFGSSGASRAWR